MPSPLVVDCDAGLDDAWGLLLAMKGGPSLNLVGITCVQGNTTVDNVCRNVLHLLATAGRYDIPVFKGACDPVVTCDPYERPDFLHFHGLNGFGDVELEQPTNPHTMEEENAIVALNRMASEYKGELTLACFGPLTNVALAVRTFPEFVSNIKEILIMGGNYKGAGNTTMCAEFNFFRDPEAAHIVLSSSFKKITILPWETCLTTQIPYIEASVLERGKKLGLKYWINCDQLLASIVLDPTVIIDSFDCYATVELVGHHTRGQMVIDHLKERKCNVKVVTTIDTEKHKSRLLALRVLP